MASSESENITKMIEKASVGSVSEQSHRQCKSEMSSATSYFKWLLLSEGHYFVMLRSLREVGDKSD